MGKGIHLFNHKTKAKFMQKKSKSEVGHAKNVANLEDLFTRCSGFGGAYNPPRPELQISNLQQKHQQAQMTLRYVAECEVREQDATNNRTAAFKTMRTLVTRIINVMIACGVSAKSVEDARVLQRRIQGSSNGKKSTSNDTPTTEEPLSSMPADATETTVVAAPRKNSTSRQSYDLLVEHLSKLILLLQREPNYTPNESELQVGALQTLEQQLRALLTLVTTTESESETARIRRTDELYDLSTGLVALALQVKSYIKAVFGSNSSQYKQVSGIRFRRV